MSLRGDLQRCVDGGGPHGPYSAGAFCARCGYRSQLHAGVTARPDRGRAPPASASDPLAKRPADVETRSPRGSRE